ncbi:GtrA family protein [Streptomyces sp. NPDC058470]|uniref:GtrA family protein n=1 Tax=Streptomyces sp. NPDC058470 TaxID=3346515 RepID=UPI003664F46F
MNSLLLSKPETAFAARGSEPTVPGMDGVRRIRVTPVTPVPLAAPVTPATPGPLASFARFVLCGGGVGLLSSAAVALLAGALPWVVANALVTVASTLLCTELHARFTFGSGRRAGWRRHWQSAGSAVGAYAVTSAAMLVLHLMQSSPGMLTEQIVYLSASGLAGVGRFLVLRLFVFAAGSGSGSGSGESGRNRISVSATVSRSVPAPRRATEQRIGARRSGPNLLSLSAS